MRKTTLLLLIAGLFAATLPAGADMGLDEVRQATAPFRSVANAEAAGYIEFLECFENPGVGGMGQHYVDLAALDGVVDATHPEAMVYEVGANGSLKLVGVEYIVPGDFVDPANPPSLFGHDFHLNPSLGVWVLHAWIWKANPAGTFEDWNPNVGRCS